MRFSLLVTIQETNKTTAPSITSHIRHKFLHTRKNNELDQEEFEYKGREREREEERRKKREREWEREEEKQEE